MLHTRNSPYNKVYNRHLVIRSLYKKPYSRAELSRSTGLTRATITNIVDELISEGLVRESGLDVENKAVGRNPTTLEIVPDCYRILCVDIGRDICCIGMVNFVGKVVTSKTVDITDAESPEQAVELICNEINNSVLSDNTAAIKILGLGITTPGPVDTLNGIVDDIPDFELWRGFHIVDEFKKYFDFEIRLERDANAISLAELYFGYGRHLDDFICIMSYIGIGFGIIKNRSLFSGNLGLTPEFGHISIDYHGAPCVCGNRGCLYEYFGLHSILKRVQKDFPDLKSWEEITDRAYNGEKYFIEIIEHYAEIFSIAVVNAINFTMLNKIVLSGFIIYRPEMFIDALKRNVRGSYIASNFFDIDIYITEMKRNENLIGAATGIIEYCFNKYR